MHINLCYVPRQEICLNCNYVRAQAHADAQLIVMDHFKCVQILLITKRILQKTETFVQPSPQKDTNDSLFSAYAYTPEPINQCA